MFDNLQNLETIFSLTSTAAMVGWVVLVFLPRRWKWLNSVPLLIIPLLLSTAYASMLLPGLLAGGGEGDFSSLAGVRTLFSSDAALLVGWIHYLAFDLLVGTIIARQGDDEGINRFIQAPFLLLTFIFGPMGFLLFQIVRGGKHLITRK